MKAGRGANQLGAELELGAAGELGNLQVFDRLEMPIDQAGIGQRPQVLGGLEFGLIRRQKQQVHLWRQAQMHAGMPSGPVEHQDNLLGGTGPDRTCELR